MAQQWLFEYTGFPHSEVVFGLWGGLGPSSLPRMWVGSELELGDLVGMRTQGPQTLEVTAPTPPPPRPLRKGEVCPSRMGGTRHYLAKSKSFRFPGPLFFPGLD